MFRCNGPRCAGIAIMSTFGPVPGSTMIDTKLPVAEMESPAAAARRQWRYDAISTASGVFLALFMWGHMLFVSSIWTGERGFDWIADMMEYTWVAQITVVIVTFAFFVHFVVASRKIPAKLQERKLIKNLGDGIRDSKWRLPSAKKSGLEKIRRHGETSLWIWQVRSGMVILVIGAVHLFMVVTDVVQRVFGHAGITSAESMGRVQGGMWLLYAVLLIAVEFHAGIGLYRVFVKWGLGKRIPLIGKRVTRRMAHTMEQATLLFFLAVGIVTLLVLADVISPPLAFLTEGE